MEKLENPTFVVMLIVLILTVIPSKLAVGSVTKPSVPEFSLKSIENPYDIPPTTTIDPYTGKTMITDFGRHIENKSIEMKIKNQPFTSFSVNGADVNLYYEAYFKGHYANASSWRSLFSIRSPGPGGEYYSQSNSDYTVISVTHDFPTDAQVDFQVRALIGYYFIVTNHVPITTYR